MSRIAMNMPTHIKVKPNQVATLAWVVLQIGVALAVEVDFSICGNGKLRDGNGPRCNSRPGRRCTPRMPLARHGRACPGHPRLAVLPALKTWMPGTSPGM